MNCIELPSLSILNEYFYDDGECLRYLKPTRYGINVGDKVGSKGPKGYLYVKFKQVNYRVHRILWKMRTGVDPMELEVDHRNRITDDNSLGNLRLLDSSLNSLNKGLYKNNQSGASCVRKISEIEYRAKVRLRGRPKSKSFSTMEAAEAWVAEVKATFLGCEPR